MKDNFLNAVTAGDVSVVREMLKAEPTLAKAADENGVSAIMKATYYRKPEVVEILLSTGSELTIFEAAATGTTDRVRELLEKDPKLVNSFSPDGFMPLSLAVFFAHEDAAKVLLNAGAEVNVPSKETMKVTPLHSAAAARQPRIGKLLIQHGADVNAPHSDSGFTPLHEAAANGDLEFAKLLLDNGADVNAKMIDGKTPLDFAVERKQESMATFLRQYST